MDGDNDQSHASGSWQFRQDDADVQSDHANFAPQDRDDHSPTATPQSSHGKQGHEAALPEVRWTASEFIEHEKDAGWYGRLGFATVVVAGLIFLVTRGDKITVGMIVILAIFFGIYASRKPRTLSYKLDGKGLTIGGKMYGYDGFRSFSAADDGAFPGITFMPLKRFSAAVTIYYERSDEAKIMRILSNYLPHEQLKRDLLEQFLHYIRF